MIDLNLRVVYRGEKVEVTDVKASDLVALERQFQVALPSLREFSFEQACFLVWRLLRREEGLQLPFDEEFLDGIEDLEQVEAPLVEPGGGTPLPER